MSGSPYRFEGMPLPTTAPKTTSYVDDIRPGTRAQTLVPCFLRAATLANQSHGHYHCSPCNAAAGYGAGLNLRKVPRLIAAAHDVSLDKRPVSAAGPSA
jgi:hypothetical protein